MGKRNDLVKDWKNIIKNTWFNNHKVRFLELTNDTTIIDWDNGSCFYKMRIILDKNVVYISGDLGSAVYTLTCKRATINEIASYDISYFTEKLTAFSSDEDEFEKGIAKTDIEEWYEEVAEFNDPEVVDNVYNILMNILEGSVSSFEEWRNELAIIKDEIETVEEFYESKLLEVGSMTNVRLYAYLEAFKMIKKLLDRELKVG